MSQSGWLPPALANPPQSSVGTVPVGTVPPGAPAVPQALPRPNPFGRDTLGRQLVIRVTVLVALAAVLITTGPTAVAARQLLIPSWTASSIRSLPGYAIPPVPGRKAVRTLGCSAPVSRSAHWRCSTAPMVLSLGAR
jgi:hypothetical protein